MPPSSPPRGSPQWAGIRDAWRDSTLAEWLLHHPEGKRLLRVLRVMKFAFMAPDPGPLGAAGRAGTSRAAPGVSAPTPAASVADEPPSAAPAAACGGPSAPLSASQRRRRRRARAGAAARAAVPAGPAGDGAAVSVPAVGAEEAMQEEAMPASGGLVCLCGPDAPLRDLLAVSVATGDIAPEEMEAVLAAAQAAPAAALPAEGGRAPSHAADGGGGAALSHAAGAPGWPGSASLGGGVGMGVAVGAGAAVAGDWDWWMGREELEEVRVEDDSDGDGVVFGARLRRREARLAAQAAVARWRAARAAGEDVVEGALAVQARAAVGSYRHAALCYADSERPWRYGEGPRPPLFGGPVLSLCPPFGAALAASTGGDVGQWAGAVEPPGVVVGQHVLAVSPSEGWRPGGAAGVEARASCRRAVAERPPSEVSSECSGADGDAAWRPRLPGKRPSAKQLRGGVSRAEARAAVLEGRAPMEAVLRALE